MGDLLGSTGGGLIKVARGIAKVERVVAVFLPNVLTGGWIYGT